MASGKAVGVSGIGVMMTSFGAILAYAAFTDQNPIEALKSIASGNPLAVSNIGKSYGRLVPIDRTSSSDVDELIDSLPGATASFPELVSGVSKYTHDIYSQSKRHQTGYSDCSSWVAKGMRAAGYDPPNPDTTYGFLRSKMWKKVSAKNAKKGDIVINSTHMVVYLGNGRGIGQQRTGVNVKTDAISNLFVGTGGGYVYLRYVGKSTGVEESNPQKAK